MVKVAGTLKKWQGTVYLRLLRIGIDPVDSLQRTRGIHRNSIGSNTNNDTVGLVQTIELQVSVPVPALEYVVPIRCGGENRVRILREWVKAQTVYHY